MLDIFFKILNNIFPAPSCVIDLQTVRNEDFLQYFRPTIYKNHLALSPYQNKIIKAAIVANKFHHYEPAAALLGKLLSSWLNNQPVKNTIIIPIPLSQKHLAKRKHNQVDSILKFVYENDYLKKESLLYRTHNTASQTKLNRVDRLKNMQGAFAYSGQPIRASRVIIVDDVITTGATLDAAKAAILTHLPPDCELICVAIAH